MHTPLELLLNIIVIEIEKVSSILTHCDVAYESVLLLARVDGAGCCDVIKNIPKKAFLRQISKKILCGKCDSKQENMIREYQIRLFYGQIKKALVFNILIVISLSSDQYTIRWKDCTCTPLHRSTAVG